MTKIQGSRVLFVDDNQNLLSAVRRNLRGHADLVVAEDADAALAILESDPAITVVISDQKMPGMKGIEFLATVARRWPLVTRVMQTGNADQDTAISAISEGRVFRFLRKPYEPEDLIEAIHDSQVEHNIRKAEHALIETTLAATIRLMSEMLAIMRPDLFAQSAKVQKLAKALSAELALSQPWEINLAALLYPIGLATLPNDLLDKRRNGTLLTAAETLALQRSGIVAGDLVGKIPKLEGVAIYLRYCRKGHDGSGLPEGTKPPDMPAKALFLLPLLIDIVELADLRGISLKDAALALGENKARYHSALLAAATGLLERQTVSEKAHVRATRDLACDELRLGDTLVNDLVDEDGQLLLAGGAELNELMVRRIQMLFASRAIPRHLIVTRSS